MANPSIVFGLLLAILGAWGFFGTGMQHPTALIPAGVGLVLIVLGAVASAGKAPASTPCTRPRPWVC